MADNSDQDCILKIGKENLEFMVKQKNNIRKIIASGTNGYPIYPSVDIFIVSKMLLEVF